jgi:phosphoribosylformimino-5-aminoimidazole carboxamide ribotide isomerase
MPQKPRLIPVLDVMGGRVVRAVGGRREEYRPVVSNLTPSCAPGDVLAALGKQANAHEFYVADLDAIAGNGELSSAVHDLIDDPGSRELFWVDIGLRSVEGFTRLPDRAGLWPVVAFETAGPGTTADIVSSLGKDDEFAFSLDMRHGELVGDWQAWGLVNDRDALGLARRVVELGVRTLIVLDLARVGTGSGTGTEPLVRAIRGEFPDVELIAGGGVKTWADVDRLGEAGADAVLVASALHDGTLRVPRPS